MLVRTAQNCFALTVLINCCHTIRDAFVSKNETFSWRTVLVPLSQVSDRMGTGCRSESG